MDILNKLCLLKESQSEIMKNEGAITVIFKLLNSQNNDILETTLNLLLKINQNCIFYFIFC